MMFGQQWQIPSVLPGPLHDFGKDSSIIESGQQTAAITFITTCSTSH